MLCAVCAQWKTDKPQEFEAMQAQSGKSRGGGGTGEGKTKKKKGGPKGALSAYMFFSKT